MFQTAARRARGVLSSGVLWSLGLATALLLAGCGSPEPLGPTSVHPSDAHGIQPPPGVALTTQECLVGGWRLEGDPLREYVLNFGPGTAVELSGHLTLGFTLDRYYVEPRVGITWENRGEQSLASLVGEAEGDYELVDGLLEIGEAQDDLALVDVVQGERGRVPELFLHPIAVNPLVGASVSCTGDSLTLSTESGGTGVQVRFERVR